MIDPACGSGGMFIQSMKFVEEHQGNVYNIGIYGQEKNPTTWRLAKMNLAIRSMYGDLGKYAADTFTEDLHKDLKADFILANPPFNLEWDRDKVENDSRWRYGLAPKNNANYAWLQHMISKLSQNGKMACILSNGSLSAGGQEGEIRKKLIENDLVDCIIAMPTNLFYTVTVIIHDLTLFDKNADQSQIDFVVLTRNCAIVLESKSLQGNITINSDGEFTRQFVNNERKVYRKEGMYSPIRQNEIHVGVVTTLTKPSFDILINLAASAEARNKFGSVIPCFASSGKIADFIYSSYGSSFGSTASNIFYQKMVKL